MSAQPLEIRMAALEGGYEQLDRRVGDLRADVIAGFARVDARFSDLDRKIDGNFKALMGWMVGQTAVLVGAVVSIALSLHH